MINADGTPLERGCKASIPHDCSALLSDLQRGASSATPIYEVLRGGVELLLRKRGYTHSEIGRLAGHCMECFRKAVLSGVLREASEVPKVIRSIINDLEPLSATVLGDEMCWRSKARIESALAKMSPAERKILHAYYVEGSSNSSICREFNLTSAALENHKSKARALFRLAGAGAHVGAKTA